MTVNPNEVAADSFSRFAIRVPNERAEWETAKIVVRLPKGLFVRQLSAEAGLEADGDDGEARPPSYSR